MSDKPTPTRNVLEALPTSEVVRNFVNHVALKPPVVVAEAKSVGFQCIVRSITKRYAEDIRAYRHLVAVTNVLGMHYDLVLQKADRKKALAEMHYKVTNYLSEMQKQGVVLDYNLCCDSRLNSDKVYTGEVIPNVELIVVLGPFNHTYDVFMGPPEWVSRFI